MAADNAACGQEFNAFDGPQKCGRVKGHPGAHTRDPLPSDRQAFDALKPGPPFSDGRAVALPHLMCGVVIHSSWHDPVACAWGRGHEGDHSWAGIPQFDPRPK